MLPDEQIAVVEGCSSEGNDNLDGLVNENVMTHARYILDYLWAEEKEE